MFKTLRQPGPPETTRFEAVDGPLLTARFDVPAGASLLDGISAGMRDAGLRSGTVRLSDFDVAALQYVRPTGAPDAEHVAFYSATHRIETRLRILLAVATFGEKDGRPFVHCHAVWADESGHLRGGHLHNDAVHAVEPVACRAWGLANAAMAVEFDAETNFHLFRPRRVAGGSASTTEPARGRCIVAKIRPNEDLLAGIERVCADAGVARATIAGSVGSIVGATFTDGREIADDATEILVVSGDVRPGPDGPSAHLQIALIDPAGDVHVGELVRGGNAVLICFELVVVEAG